MSLLPRHSLLDINDLFDSWLSPISRAEQVSGLFSPRVDITDKDNVYEIVADLPGVDKENLSVTLEDGVLTIEATTADESSEQQDGRIIRQERRTGKYHRSFTLGHDVQESDIDAVFNNGVLTLTAPKLEAAIPERKLIEIQ